MRLIDADALKAWIDSEIDFYKKACEDAKTAGEMETAMDCILKATRLNVIADYVNKMPTANAWIPCSERLPDANGYYLVSGFKGDRSKVYTTFFYKDGGYFWWNHSLDDCKAGAWMPLPAPYGGEA